jgi:hypothetical protein
MRDVSPPDAKDGENSDSDRELPIIRDEDWPIQVYDGDLEEDLDRFVSIKEAERVVGGVSFARKIPEASFFPRQPRVGSQRTYSTVFLETKNEAIERE